LRLSWFGEICKTRGETKVQYSLLGRSGLVVSRLALGSMTFTGGARTVPSINSVDQQLADRLVSCALGAGVNFFDTADNYDLGQSEEVLGRALKGRRNDAVIATKVGMRTGPGLTDSGLSRRHLLKSVDESLGRLGTDWIDVYIAHRPDPFTPLDEVVDAFDAVVRSGKVRYIGFSNWPAWRAAAALERQKARNLVQFTHAQM
jgi:aryl-alcohol dehydrogenase-like predicted oxidoreductase